jgi:hypothetical protein
MVRDSIVRDSAARTKQDSINRTLPGYVIDSILPVEEEMRRFRAAIGGTAVDTLRNASRTRDALVERFVKAITVQDSVELRSMLLDAREFVDLVYPESPSTKPPYRQSPGLVWRSIQAPSEMGFRRLMRRASGLQVTLASYRCNVTPLRQGKNVLWSGCHLELVNARGVKETHRLFGTIIEREGRYKFVSYKNEF